MTDGSDRATFRVERSVELSVAPEVVYPYLADFRRWTGWSPWEDIDPNLYRTYEGADAGVGAVYEWHGNRKAGQGRMEVIAAAPPTSLDIQLDFVKPFKSSSTASFAVESVGTGSHVTWSMVGPKTFMTRLMGVFMSMERMIGPDFEKGLARLKALVEA